MKALTPEIRLLGCEDGRYSFIENHLGAVFLKGRCRKQRPGLRYQTEVLLETS